MFWKRNNNKTERKGRSEAAGIWNHSTEEFIVSYMKVPVFGSKEKSSNPGLRITKALEKNP